MIESLGFFLGWNQNSVLYLLNKFKINGILVEIIGRFNGGICEKKGKVESNAVGSCLG